MTTTSDIHETQQETQTACGLPKEALRTESVFGDLKASSCSSVVRLRRRRTQTLGREWGRLVACGIGRGLARFSQIGYKLNTLVIIIFSSLLPISLIAHTMWLLNAETFELALFNHEGEIPEYVILSHTWTDEEISFQEMREGFHSGFDHLRNKSGWKKIEGTCRLAKQVYLSAGACHFVWIDTCCIDKSSSAELQEAINSMFRWYEKARACFVYLSDVPTDQDPAAEGSAFRESRWFTRGWTLQELLAPRIVLFFDNLWHMIGCKDKFKQVIHNITGIRETYVSSDPNNRDLRAYDRLSRASVAERMSWAASRETTKEEDIAYCLLGIFDIHMPLIYGEGARAITRLQEEIMKVSDDNSLLCWGFKQPIGEIDVSCQESSILAPHPRYFENCHGITTQALEGFDVPSFSMSQRGLRISLPVRADISHNKVVYGILACGVEDSPHHTLHSSQPLMAIPLISTSTTRGEVSYFRRQVPQNGEYWKPTWCRPSLVSNEFLKQARLMDLIIRRPLGYDNPTDWELPFALAMPPIPSEAFDVLGTYPPQPIRRPFISYGDFASQQRPPWTASFRCPDYLPNRDMLANGDGWIGYAEEGQRMIQIQLPEGGLLVVLDYQAVTVKDIPGPIWDHKLSCRTFDMPFNFSWERLHTLAITQDYTQYKQLDIRLPESGNKDSKRNLYRMATDPNIYVEVDMRLSERHPYITDIIISVFEQSNGKLIPRAFGNNRVMRWLHSTKAQDRHRQKPRVSCPGCSRINLVGNRVPDDMVAAKARLEELSKARIRDAERWHC